MQNQSNKSHTWYILYYFRPIGRIDLNDTKGQKWMKARAIICSEQMLVWAEGASAFSPPSEKRKRCVSCLLANRVCRQYGGAKIPLEAAVFEEYVLLFVHVSYPESAPPDRQGSEWESGGDSSWCKLDPHSGGGVDGQIVSSVYCRVFWIVHWCRLVKMGC